MHFSPPTSAVETVAPSHGAPPQGHERAFDVAAYRRKLDAFNHSHNYRMDLDALFSVVREMSFTAILDVGCGTGFMVREARKRHPACRVEGIDRFDFDGEGCWVADVCSVDFSWQRRYDLLTMVHAINHLVDLERAIENLNVLLEPGGHLLIANPNPAFVKIIRTLNAYGHLETRGGDDTVVAYLGAAEIDRVVNRCGLDRVLHREYGEAIRCTVHGTDMVIRERELLSYRKRG
ncbi:methyltransferase domain-containing protein [Polyangium sp. 15x6]|nr:methyltransferase domain-containing protein [Polyangium sp. 15x6]